ncbi:putative molybdenum cofactor guanylyltransferase [Hoyosella rhizosphaerae]|uniref:Molybdenum cofactor guanylyltransferase n=2 Tax=Hoyosella rhizosphaerae TaxID=1755582 RepID=A0A916UIQ1_9ACTN|nr:putative molybdenum cofactor guanylyltransferase [Hoyosella rhizosphaerae]
MGQDKATLPWRGSTMLEHSVTMLKSACPRVYVVTADGRAVPETGATIVSDTLSDYGPLHGLARGLRAAYDDGAHDGGAHDGGAQWAFVCAVDMPFLEPSLIDALVTAIEPSIDIVAAHDGTFPQPLAAIYKLTLAESAENAVSSGMRSLNNFVTQHQHKYVMVPGAESQLRNLNTPDDYRDARS